jgi:hypothetical protein
MYVNIISAIMGIIHRLIFYLKHTEDNVRTSQETHYVFATNPTATCDLWVCDDGTLK